MSECVWCGATDELVDVNADGERVRMCVDCMDGGGYRPADDDDGWFEPEDDGSEYDDEGDYAAYGDDGLMTCVGCGLEASLDDESTYEMEWWFGVDGSAFCSDCQEAAAENLGAMDSSGVYSDFVYHV